MDYEIELIKNYINHNLDLESVKTLIPWQRTKGIHAERLFYARWAANELLIRCMTIYYNYFPEDSIFIDGFDIIDDFIMQLFYFQTIKQSFMFRIAIETSEDIKKYLKIFL